MTSADALFCMAEVMKVMVSDTPRRSASRRSQIGEPIERLVGPRLTESVEVGRRKCLDRVHDRSFFARRRRRLRMTRQLCDESGHGRRAETPARAGW